MNTPEQTALLVEALTTAHREQDPRQLRFHPAFYDLDGAGRDLAFAATHRQRQLEAALDDDGYSSTVRAVLGRLGG